MRSDVQETRQNQIRETLGAGGHARTCSPTAHSLMPEIDLRTGEFIRVARPSAAGTTGQSRREACWRRPRSTGSDLLGSIQFS